MMAKLIAAVEQLVNDEYAHASKDHGERFHSQHEAYAIIKEEVEEAKESLIKSENTLCNIWSCNCRRDSDDMYDYRLRSLKRFAVDAAAECIQVAAMAHKAQQGVKK